MASSDSFLFFSPSCTENSVLGQTASITPPVEPDLTREGAVYVLCVARESPFGLSAAPHKAHETFFRLNSAQLPPPYHTALDDPIDHKQDKLRLWLLQNYPAGDPKGRPSEGDAFPDLCPQIRKSEH